MESYVFDKLRGIIYMESGIVLSPEKLPLLQNRLQGRLRQLNLKSEREYLNLVELDVSGEELINLIDAVSTNVTHFYREKAHFSHFHKILTELKKRNSEIKIWCAAASSGEEPYTLAFEALTALNTFAPGFRILATDICTKVLRKAIVGQYQDSQVMTVPHDLKNRFMVCNQGSSNFTWNVKPEVKEHIIFKKLNLVKFPYPLNSQIDVIFCRNVMIYFDRETRQRIIDEFDRLLAPGGYLFLSHSENLLGINNNFIKLGASVFQKVLA